jgi:hypothetical protein
MLGPDPDTDLNVAFPSKALDRSRTKQCPRRADFSRHPPPLVRPPAREACRRYRAAVRARNGPCPAAYEAHRAPAVADRLAFRSGATSPERDGIVKKERVHSSDQSASALLAPRFTLEKIGRRGRLGTITRRLCDHPVLELVRQQQSCARRKTALAPFPAL